MKEFIFILIGLFSPFSNVQAKDHWQPVAFKSVTLDTEGNLIVTGVQTNSAWEFRLNPRSYSDRPNWWHIYLQGRRTSDRGLAVVKKFQVKLNLVKSNCQGRRGIVVLGGYRKSDTSITQRMQISLKDVRSNLVAPPPRPIKPVLPPTIRPIKPVFVISYMAKFKEGLNRKQIVAVLNKYGYVADTLDCVSVKKNVYSFTLRHKESHGVICAMITKNPEVISIQKKYDYRKIPIDYPFKR